MKNMDSQGERQSTTNQTKTGTSETSTSRRNNDEETDKKPKKQERSKIRYYVKIICPILLVLGLGLMVTVFIYWSY